MYSNPSNYNNPNPIGSNKCWEREWQELKKIMQDWTLELKWAHNWSKNSNLLKTERVTKTKKHKNCSRLNPRTEMGWCSMWESQKKTKNPERKHPNWTQEWLKKERVTRTHKVVQSVKSKKNSESKGKYKNIKTMINHRMNDPLQLGLIKRFVALWHWMIHYNFHFSWSRWWRW